VSPRDRRGKATLRGLPGQWLVNDSAVAERHALPRHVIRGRADTISSMRRLLLQPEVADHFYRPAADR
jgi:hypothetical protein